MPTDPSAKQKMLVQILLVEDSPTDALLLKSAVDKDSPTAEVYRLTVAEKLSQALHLLRDQAFDIVLLDLGLPDSQGIATFTRLREQAPHVPVVVLSGLQDDEVAAQAVQAGAQDFLIKGQAGQDSIRRVIRYAMERQQVQAALLAGEKRFRALIENSANAIALLSADGSILYESPSARQVLGYSLDDLVGRSVFDYAHPDELAKLFNIMGQVLQQPRKPVNCQIRFKHNDKMWHWAEITANNLLDEPAVQAVVINYHDVTERRKAEEALSASEARYRLLAENMADVIWVLDPVALRFTYVSPSVLRLRGYTAEETLAQSFEEVLAPDSLFMHKNMVKDRVQDFLNGDPKAVTHTNEIQIIQKGGGALWVETVSSLMKNADGGVSMLGVVRDISARKRADEELRANSEALRKSSAALRESEARLKLALEGSQMGVWELDLQNQDLYWSPECIKIIGATNFGGRLKDFTDVVHPEDIQRVMASIDQAVIERTPFASEFRILHPNGEIRWVSNLGRARYDENGQPQRMVGTVQDITERRRAEIERQALLEMMQGLATAGDLPEFLRLVHRAVGRVVDAKNFFVILYNKNTQLFEEVYSADEFDPPSPPSRLEKSISAYVLNTGKPLLLTQARFNELLAAGEVNLVGARCAAWMGAPLKTSREAIGVMVVQNYEDPNRYTEHDLDFLTSIAGQVALALDRKLRETEVAHLNRQMKLILDSAGEGIYGSDIDGKVTFINPAMEQMLGWGPGELLGRSMHAACHHSYPDGRPNPAEACTIHLALGHSNAVHSDNEVFWHRDGTSFPVELTSTPIREENQITGAVVVVKDISERRQMEKEARRQTARTETLARISQLLAAAARDSDGLQSIVAREVSELIGGGCLMRLVSDDQQWLITTALYHPNPQALKNMQELISAGPLPIDRNPTAQAYCSGQPVVMASINPWAIDPPIQPAFRAFLEQYPDTSLAILPLRAQGQVTGTLTILRTSGQPFTEDETNFLQDLADRAALAIANARLLEQVQRQNVQLEQRVAERTADLSRANAELERTARAKDEFLASMSHELRTPLNAILTLSESLEEGIYGPLSDPQIKPLRTVTESGYHLLNLINDILDLSKIEAGKLELQLTRVETTQVCQASLRLVKQIAQKKRLQVSLDLDPAVNYLTADARYLKQMLVNLLSNAVKFTHEGGKIGLEVRGDEGMGVARLSVWDTGIGIAADQIQRLFRPFVQVDSGLARQYGGTGLGLALVYRMAEMHGGSVALESTPGAGSRFTITLPWSGPVNVHHTGLLKPTGVPNFQQALVIEDSPTAADQLARYIGELGAQVTIHVLGQTALNKALEIQPEVILLDIQLPDLSGWNVLEQLKAHPRTRSIPVVVVTGVDERERGLAMGAADYILKPLTRPRLYEALGKALAPAPVQRSDLSAVHPGSRPVILIAEDNLASQATFSDYLTIKGYRVVLAGNGVEAIDRAAETPPDLVLMDIQMPKMDGLEATRRLRANSALTSIPIIAVTALAMPGDRGRCLAAGANDYLTKPVSLKRLIQLIEAHLPGDGRAAIQ